MSLRNASLVYCLLLLAPTDGWGVSRMVEFQGVVTLGSDAFNSLDLGTDLKDKSIRGSMIYRTEDAPPDTDPGPTFSLHQSECPNSDWFSLPQVFIDDVEVPVPDFSVIDPFQVTDTASINLRDFEPPMLENIGYFRQRTVESVDGSTANYSILVGVFDALDIIHSSDLAATYQADNLGIIQSASFAATSTVEDLAINIITFRLSSINVSPVEVLGDYNGDEIVDVADLAVWRETYGSSSELRADGDGNGRVDGHDFLIWQSNVDELTAGVTSAVVVPEPMTVTLALVTMFYFAFLGRTTSLRL